MSECQGGQVYRFARFKYFKNNGQIVTYHLKVDDKNYTIVRLSNTFFTYPCKTWNFTVPFKGPPRYNPKRRSVAFGGMTTSCSASNLGTLTRIPSAIDTPCGTLTRTISVDQYSSSGTLSRLPISEISNTSSLSRTPPADNRNSCASMSRVIDHYSGISDSHHSSLNRVPSIESNRPDCGNLQRIPSEQQISGIKGHQMHTGISRTEHHQNNINRLPSEYQTPALRDPNPR